MALRPITILSTSLVAALTIAGCSQATGPAEGNDNTMSAALSVVERELGQLEIDTNDFATSVAGAASLERVAAVAAEYDAEASQIGQTVNRALDAAASCERNGRAAALGDLRASVHAMQQEIQQALDSVEQAGEVGEASGPAGALEQQLGGLLDEAQGEVEQLSSQADEYSCDSSGPFDDDEYDDGAGGSGGDDDHCDDGYGAGGTGGDDDHCDDEHDDEYEDGAGGSGGYDDDHGEGGSAGCDDDSDDDSGAS